MAESTSVTVGVLRETRGFTLAEALIATLLSSLVVILVTSVFLVQNQFYSDTVNRSTLQESIRGAVSRVSSELSGVSAGGVLTAEPGELALRIPILLGGVCGVQNGETYVFLPLGGEEVDESLVRGYALRDDSSGWQYHPASWGSIHHSSGASAAQVCALAGADTVGAVGDFHRLDGLASPGTIQIGDLVMVYKEVEFKLGPSTLVPGAQAVFRGPVGEDLTEFATGLSEESGFEYGVSNKAGFQDRVTGKGNLVRIEKVRVSFTGTGPAARGGGGHPSFGLSRTVTLQDVN